MISAAPEMSKFARKKKNDDDRMMDEGAVDFDAMTFDVPHIFS